MVLETKIQISEWKFEKYLLFRVPTFKFNALQRPLDVLQLQEGQRLEEVPAEVERPEGGQRPQHLGEQGGQLVPPEVEPRQTGQGFQRVSRHASAFWQSTLLCGEVSSQFLSWAIFYQVWLQLFFSKSKTLTASIDSPETIVTDIQNG